MLAKENLIEKNTAATLELADFPLHKGSVGLLVQKWESTAAASRPGPVLPHSPAPRARLPRIGSCSSTVAQVSAGSSRADGLQDNPDGPQHTQPFPVSVKELRNRFEALGDKKETEKSSLTSALKSEPGSPSVSPLKESTVKRGRAIFEKMSSKNEHSKISEVGSRKPLGGRPKESTPGTDNIPLDFQETISLKDRLDLYKAAVSKSESINSFADTSENTNLCTVPGYLAAVRKQFEKATMNSLQEISAQCQHQHQSVQPGHTEDLEKLSPQGTEKKRRRRARRKAKKQPLPETTEDLVVTDTARGTSASAKENVTHAKQKEKGSDGTQPCHTGDSMKLGPGGTQKKRRRRARRRSKKQPLPVTTEYLVVTAPLHETSTEENMSHADQKAKELDETQPGHTSDPEKLSPPAQTSPLQKQKEKKKEKNRKKHFILWFRMGCG